MPLPFSRNIYVPMYPVADVTASLPAGATIVQSMEGMFAMVGGGGAGINTLTRMADGAAITVEGPPIDAKTYYRNVTPHVGFDPHSRSIMSKIVTPALTPAQWKRNNHDGKFLWPASWNSAGLIMDESIEFFFAYIGHWYGVVRIPTNKLNNTQPYNPTGPLIIQEVHTDLVYSQVDAPAYPWGAQAPSPFAIIPGATNSYHHWTWIFYQPAASAGQRASWYYAKGQVMRGYPDIVGGPAPGEGSAFLADSTIPITSECFEAAPAAAAPTSYGILSDVGPYRSYVFQGGAWGLDLSICCLDPSGTAIAPATGLPDHSGRPTWWQGGLTCAVPFDCQFGGVGNNYVPQFPVAFSFEGKTYELTSPGVMGAMCVINDNLAAIVKYPTPGANVLFQGGLSYGTYKRDTLNWKRSLTYGKRGPRVSGIYGF